MQLPKGSVVAVADGAQLHLFKNHGDEGHMQLQGMPAPGIDASNHSAGARHSSSAADPNDRRQAEDSYAAATAAWLNGEVLGNRIEHLVIVAAPKTLGELRKHYHKKLEGVLVKELSKDLTGHGAADVEAALQKG